MSQIIRYKRRSNSFLHFKIKTASRDKTQSFAFFVIRAGCTATRDLRGSSACEFSDGTNAFSRDDRIKNRSKTRFREVLKRRAVTPKTQKICVTFTPIFLQVLQNVSSYTPLRKSVRHNERIASFVQEIASFGAAPGCCARLPVTSSVGITRESPRKPRQRWDFARQHDFRAHVCAERLLILVGEMPTTRLRAASPQIFLVPH